MTTDQYVEAFQQGSRHASRDYDEFGMARVIDLARKLRRGPCTPYADGYCVRVGELSRHHQPARVRA